MQKKLLLSLMCTSAAALPALADVALTVPDVTNWNTTGITSSEGLTTNGTQVSCKVGVGTVYQKVTGLPAGKYKISFASLTNAAISLEGAQLTIAKDKLSGTFELKAQGDITIQINAVNAASDFGFNDGRLTFVEDFAKQATEFQKSLDKAEELILLNTKITAPKALVDKNKALVAQKKSIDAIIATLAQADKSASEAVSVADLIKIYSASKATSFADLFNTLKESIASYTADVATYNPQFKQANTEQDNKDANAAAKAALEASIKSMTADINVLVADITAKDTDEKVAEVNLPAAEAFQKTLKAFADEVKAAFPAGATNKIDTKALDEKCADLQEELAALQAKFDNDVEAVKIFKQVQAVYSTEGYTIENTYLAATANISAITDATQYGNKPDVYASNKTEWLTEIQNIYNPIKMPATFEDVDASMGVEGYKAAIQEAMGKINAVVETAQNFAKEQNDAYVAGYNLYNTPKTGWDARMADYKARLNAALPAELNTQYQTLLTKAETAVNAFKTYLNDTYADPKKTLPGDSYDAKVNDVNTAFQALDNFLDGPYGLVSDLIVGLDRVKKDTDAKLAKLELSGKFDASYASVQAAIDVLVKKLADGKLSVNDADLKNTQDALAALENAASQFIDAFTKAHDELVKARTNLNNFIKAITSKYCAKTGGEYALADVAAYKTLDTKLNGKDGFEAQYKAASDAIGQEAYDKGIALAGSINEFAASIVTAQNTWLVDATNANLAFANARVAELEAFVAEYGAPTSIKLEDIKKALGKVTVPAAGAATTEFDKADKAVKAQMDAMSAFYASVNNYKAVLKAIDAIDAPSAAATAKNNEVNNVGGTKTPAYDYYAKLIADYTNVEAITKALNAAYNGKDGVTDAVKTDLVNQANTKVGALKNVPDLINANQKAYSDQISRSGDVRTEVQRILDNVKKAEYQGVVTDWVKTLEDLLNVRLIANDVAVGNAYGKGASVASNTELMAEYDAILAAANEVAKAYTDGYDARIIDANNGLNAEFSAWGGVDKQLNDEYIAAVKLYTFYKYNITEDAGYADFMHAWTKDGKTLVENYAEVYDFLPVIQKLNSDLQALIGKANEAKQYLPESEKYQAQYDALVADQAAQLSALKAMHDNLAADANAAAAEYYADKTSEFTTAIAAAKAELTAATMGFTAKEAEDGLKPAQTLLNQAKDMHDNPGTLGMGEVVNSIATQFFAKIDVETVKNAAILGKWNTSYSNAYNGVQDKDPNKAIKSVAELRTSMVENGASDAALKNFDKVANQMVALNTKATTAAQGAKAPIYTELAKYITDLNGLRAQLDEMAKDASDYNQYKDLWNGYQDEIADLQEAIDALNAYIAELTLDGPVRVANEPEVALGVLKNLVGSKPNSGLAEDRTKTAIETQKKLVEQYIADKKIAANDAAVVVLNTWLNKTKEAYNTAIANGAKPADIVAEYNTIQDMTAKIAELPGKIHAEGGFVGDFPAVANGYLNTLLDTYKKLNPTGSADELAAAKAELGKQKSAVEKLVAEAKANLENEVTVGDNVDEDALYDMLMEQLHAQMDPMYDALLEELTAIEAAWNAEGQALVVNRYEYAAKLAAFSDKIDAITDKAPALYNEIKVSVENTIGLNEANSQYEGLVDFYNEVHTIVEGYGYLDTYKTAFEDAQEVIDDLKAAIEKQSGKKALKPTMTLSEIYKAAYNVDCPDVVDNLQSVAASAANMKTSELMYAAYDKYNETYQALVGKYFVNIAELRASCNKLASIFNTAYDEYRKVSGAAPMYANLDKYNGWMADFQSVIDGAAKLLEDAEGQEYTPGVVVDRESTEVSSQDVQVIVNWVGNGVSYAELAASETTAWQAAAADLNGDKSLNIGDINLDIDLMLGKPVVPISNNNMFRAPAAAAVQTGASYNLAYLGEVDGAQRYALALNNTIDCIGAQFDIKLPVGMSLVQVLPTERTENHSVLTFEHDAYQSRVLIFSMSNETVKGNNGAVVYIDVQGNGSFSLDEMIITDTNCVTYGVGNPGTSGIIDAIIDGAAATKEAIYDAAGRMYDRVQRGVNIIRHSDGTVTKEIRK